MFTLRPVTGTLVQYRIFHVKYLNSSKRFGPRVEILDLRHGKKRWLDYQPNRTVCDQAKAYLEVIGITLDGIAECGPHKGPLLLTRDLVTPLR